MEMIVTKEDIFVTLFKKNAENSYVSLVVFPKDIFEKHKKQIMRIVEECDSSSNNILFTADTYQELIRYECRQSLFDNYVNSDYPNTLIDELIAYIDSEEFSLKKFNEQFAAKIIQLSKKQIVIKNPIIVDGILLPKHTKINFDNMHDFFILELDDLSN